VEGGLIPYQTKALCAATHLDILSRATAHRHRLSPRSRWNQTSRSARASDRTISTRNVGRGRIGRGEMNIDILQKGPATHASLHDVQMADAVLVLGEDVTNTAPLL